MNIFLSFVAIFLFYIAGLSVLFSLPLKKIAIDLKIGLSYGLGVSLITIQMLLYMFFHIPWNPIFLIIPWIVYVFIIRKKLNFTIIKIRRLSIKEIFLICLIGIVILFVICESLLRPVINWDSWANWFLAGKALYMGGSLNYSYITYANNSSPPV